MGEVCHLSTVHRPGDVRIYHKECGTLAKAGYDVTFVVPSAEPVSSMNGVVVRAIPPARSRRYRALTLSRVAFREALQTDASVYHFHDSELIPVGMALRARGKHVIYDVHENLPDAILSKPYLPIATRRVVAEGARLAERGMARVASAVVAATPAIARRFPPSKTVTVQNFPLLSELVARSPRPFSERPLRVVYTGGITEARGAVEMVEAIGKTIADCRLTLVGKFDRAHTEQGARQDQGWQQVDFHGWQPRSELPGLLSDARVGLVLFHPEPNHVEAMPNKLFEYMSAGLPVIASNFPLWRSIVEEAECGLLVDPLDSGAIAQAIDWMLAHPEEAEAMGRRGRIAVEERYNWDREAEKLVNLYRRLLS